jgi:hypothetical protein
MNMEGEAVLSRDQNIIVLFVDSVVPLLNPACPP